ERVLVLAAVRGKLGEHGRRGRIRGAPRVGQPLGLGAFAVGDGGGGCAREVPLRAPHGRAGRRRHRDDDGKSYGAREAVHGFGSIIGPPRGPSGAKQPPCRSLLTRRTPRRTEVRGPRSDVRGPRSEVRGPTSEVRGLLLAAMRVLNSGGGRA